MDDVMIKTRYLICNSLVTFLEFLQPQLDFSSAGIRGRSPLDSCHDLVRKSPEFLIQKYDLYMIFQTVLICSNVDKLYLELVHSD